MRKTTWRRAKQHRGGGTRHAGGVRRRGGGGARGRDGVVPTTFIIYNSQVPAQLFYHCQAFL